MAVTAVTTGDRLAILDGWRAASILLVLAAHLLPLDAVLEGLNEAAGVAGMAVFFTLSGFLITRFLLARPEPAPFLVRRVVRILPLAWGTMLVLFVCQGAPLFPGSVNPPGVLVSNLLFVANIPPVSLMAGGGHLWSLCVEMQFYVGVALLVAAGGRRALLALPLLALAVTANRIVQGQPTSIVTLERLDEILAGATIALIHAGHLGDRVRGALAAMNLYVLFALALACCFFVASPIAYLRPYAVAALVGATLSVAPRWLAVPFESRVAAYVAEISYALYVFHGVLGATWLGSGETAEKYAKRIPLIALTFGLAHVSTFYFEKRFNDWGKNLTRRVAKPSLSVN